MVKRKHSSISVTDKLPRERITPNLGKSVAFCSSQITWDCVSSFSTQIHPSRGHREEIQLQQINRLRIALAFLCPDGNISHCLLFGLNLTCNSICILLAQYGAFPSQTGYWEKMKCRARIRKTKNKTQILLNLQFKNLHR